MSSLRDLSRQVDDRAALGDFLAYCRLLTTFRGDLNQALAVAEQRNTDRVKMVLRAAISAGTTSDTTWASSLSLYQQMSSAFLASLSTSSVFDRLLAGGMRRVPLKTKIAISTAALVGAEVGESMVKPISVLSLDLAAVAPRKTVAIVTMTDELARFSSPSASDLLSSELRAGVSRASDHVFMAGLLTAATSHASTGSTVTAFIADLWQALASLSYSGDTQFYVVAEPVNVRAVALMRGENGAAFAGVGPLGGTLMPGVTLLPCDQLPSQTILVLAADGIVGDTGEIVVDGSRQATLVLDGLPDSPDTAATLGTSLFQTGLRALRAERWLGFDTRDNAVAAITSARYDSSSP